MTYKSEKNKNLTNFIKSLNFLKRQYFIRGLIFLILPFQVAIAAVNTAPTFFVGGKAVTDIAGFGSQGESVAMQPDGKILVAGNGRLGFGTPAFALVRYKANGTLDTSFSGDGKVSVGGIGFGSSDWGNSLKLQSDGKILVAGQSYNGNNFDFSLVRLNTDGSLDTTFSGDGKLVTSISTGDDGGQSVTVQPDGKILVAGSSGNFTNSDFALARYNKDGTLDKTFSGDGRLTTSIGPNFDYGSSIALQSDGKILVAGLSQKGPNQGTNFALARYNSNGTLDTTFSGDGKQTAPIGPDKLVQDSVLVQPDGKILVGGTVGGGIWGEFLPTYFALVRFNSNGTLDSTFSGDGMLTTDIGISDDSGRSVALQLDGKILLAGTSQTFTTIGFGLARYNSYGDLDTTFSNDGKVLTPIGLGSEGKSVAVQANGQILLAGYTTQPNGITDSFALVRYNKDGSLDRNFATINTLGGTTHYIKNGSAVVLDSNVQIYDAELASLGNYNGAVLTLKRHGGTNAQDVFGNKFNGTLAILIEGHPLVVNGKTIGTVITNSAGTLKFKFNGAATQQLVNSVMQQITYMNSSNTPPAKVQIDWYFNDGNISLQGSGGAFVIVGNSTVTITTAP
jgi:uncharacterized delta-60 repeat protein